MTLFQKTSGALIVTSREMKPQDYMWVHSSPTEMDTKFKRNVENPDPNRVALIVFFVSVQRNSTK